MTETKGETKVFSSNEFACPLSLALANNLSLWNFLRIGVSLLLEVGGHTLVYVYETVILGF